jgi:cytochrome c-type biogenesis protein CcmH
MRSNWILLLFLLAGPAHALPIAAPLPSPPQEARARALFHELRCVVCEGESIADSNAAVAADMRRDVRRRIAAGESDGQIKAYLVSRYGDVILMRPPLKSATALLWFGPLIILALASLLAVSYFRRRA